MAENEKSGSDKPGGEAVAVDIEMDAMDIDLPLRDATDAKKPPSDKQLHVVTADIELPQGITVEQPPPSPRPASTPSPRSPPLASPRSPRSPNPSPCSPTTNAETSLTESSDVIKSADAVSIEDNTLIVDVINEAGGKVSAASADDIQFDITDEIVEEPLKKKGGDEDEQEEDMDSKSEVQESDLFRMLHVCNPWFQEELDSLAQAITDVQTMDGQLFPEMDELTKAITEVQSLDNKLFEAKQNYQKDLTETRRKMYKMYKSHRVSIEKAKPFFMAKDIENQVGCELEQAGDECEAARFAFEDSKENEMLAEGALKSAQENRDQLSDSDFSVIMENWNRATNIVLENSRKRADGEDTFRKKQDQFKQAQMTADQIFLDLRPHVQKAWPYYAMKESCEKVLENKRHEINQYDRQLSLAKETYKETFSRLNLVATEIQQRKYLNNLTRDNAALVHNLSQFEEISDIEMVLASLEMKTDNISTCLDNIDGTSDDYDFDLMHATSPSLRGLMVRSQSLFEYSPTDEQFVDQPPEERKHERSRTAEDDVHFENELESEKHPGKILREDVNKEQQTKDDGESLASTDEPHSQGDNQSEVSDKELTPNGKVMTETEVSAENEKIPVEESVLPEKPPLTTPVILEEQPIN